MKRKRVSKLLKLLAVGALAVSCSRGPKYITGEVKEEFGNVEGDKMENIFLSSEKYDQANKATYGFILERKEGSETLNDTIRIYETKAGGAYFLAKSIDQGDSVKLERIKLKNGKVSKSSQYLPAGNVLVKKKGNKK